MATATPAPGPLLPVLVIRPDGTRGRQRKPARPQQQDTPADTDGAGPVHRVFVVQDARTASAACCVVHFASGTGETHEVRACDAR